MLAHIQNTVASDREKLQRAMDRVNVQRELERVEAEAGRDQDKNAGYMLTASGEVIGDFKILAKLGHGMYSNVFRALCLSNPKTECAVKVSRIQMHGTGEKEFNWNRRAMVVAKELGFEDRLSNYHTSFEHRGFLRGHGFVVVGRAASGKGEDFRPRFPAPHGGQVWEAVIGGVGGVATSRIHAF